MKHGQSAAVSAIRIAVDGESSEVIDVGALLSARAAPLPYCLKIVLENLLRQRGAGDMDELIEKLVNWTPASEALIVPLAVDRVILPDSSGLPVLLDFAALRDALVRRGADPTRAEPVIPCHLVVDHSLIVDEFGHEGAIEANLKMEFVRNSERYRVFKWAQNAFSKVKVVPPGMGIIHQVHLEYLAQVVTRDGPGVHPEFILGCDSHTPMVNALGVLGWGVGGIDAEAALVGERYSVRIPRVVGIRLKGSLKPGVTTTDLVLTLTEKLRAVGVVGDFIEFTGEGLNGLSVPERATIANMAPEYGVTCSYFPIDDQTLLYLAQTGREASHIDLVRKAAGAMGLFRGKHAPEPDFSHVVTIDLATIVPSVAGPNRPHDRISLDRVKQSFGAAAALPREDGGLGAEQHDPRHGQLAIAAITACTNTSNPRLMIGAGLLARNAASLGLKPPPYVKTSLAPGSRVVIDYLGGAGLLESLEALGFFTVGFGCTTCSGKSGPIDPELERAAREDGTVLASILSGNRNFDGRIHKSVLASYLGSPMLVVAFALAGRIDVDFDRQPLGVGPGGDPVYLSDIWPTDAQIDAILDTSVRPESFRRNYAQIYAGTSQWQALDVPLGHRFPWDAASSYIRKPPFFDEDFIRTRKAIATDTVSGARVLARFGDNLTTDHITPSGEIGEETLAGQYLASLGVEKRMFNAYTQRRGNHEVLVRATFANPRIRNLLVSGIEGGYTRHFPDGATVSIYDAAKAYRETGVPMLVLAGNNYGMGSSRDWAAKGPALLGVSMVIAVSFERIHRANLIGVGIVPATFEKGENAETLGLDGSETYEIGGLRAGIETGALIEVRATRADGRQIGFRVEPNLYGLSERRLLLKGGIFPQLLDRLTGDGADDEKEERR